MAFPASYLDKSTAIMNSINKDLSKEFKTLVKFYLYSPASIPKVPNNIEAFSEDHLTRQVIVNPSQCKSINLPYDSNQTIYKINSFTNVGFICEKERILK